MKLLTTTALLGALTAWSGGANAACDRMEKVSAVWLPIMQTTAYYRAGGEAVRKGLHRDRLEQVGSAQPDHR
ncbi:MAG: hypothetical protein ACXU84_20600, partial [Xanthobacteraceae bacterium]